MKQHALTLGAFLLLSIAWTWPLALEPTTTAVSGFDTWGVVWTVHAAQNLDATLVTDVSGWPVGQDLRRSDSMLLLLAARALPFRVDPLLVVSLICVLGPVVSAFAAERCAAALGAKWPWSLIAGVSFGFLGISSATIAGGQVYALFNPWLPLLGWAWVTSTSASGTWRHGVWAGLAWFLCLLTTVYVGIAATLLVLAGLPRLWRSRDLKPALAAAAVALPMGLAYVALFASSSMRADPPMIADPVLVLEMGSTTLAGLAGGSRSAAALFHDVVPLGWTVVALVALAPWVLRGRETRWWLVLGVLALLLSIGPSLRPESTMRGLFPWVLRPFATETVAAWFRFPVRLLWVTGLAFGVVAARMLTRLGERPRLAAPILLLAFVEAVLLSGRPWSPEVPTVLPSAYAATPEDRAVLDLFPPSGGRPLDYELYHVGQTCAWAALHGRPVSQFCLETNIGQDPRGELSDWLHERLLAGGELGDRLSELGFGAIVLRPDHYLPNDRALLLEGLEKTFGEPVAESFDGGEHLLVFEVPPSDADPVSTWRALHSSG